MSPPGNDQRRTNLFVFTVCRCADGTLLFASEIKALLAHPAFEKKLNEARLPDWLSMEYLPDSETLFAGVYELPPAHTLLWQDGRLTTARYAAPQFRPRPGSLRHYAGAIGDALADSAAAHRIADVPVAGAILISKKKK